MLRVNKHKLIRLFQHRDLWFELAHDLDADGYSSYAIALAPRLGANAISHKTTSTKERYYLAEYEYEFLHNLLAYGHPYPSFSGTRYKASFRLGTVTTSKIEIEVKPSPEMDWRLGDTVDITPLFYTIYQLLLSENAQEATLIDQKEAT